MRAVLFASVFAFAVVVSSSSSMACNLGDSWCNPFDLGPMPNIQMEKPLQLERQLAPAVITPRKETAAEWCLAYFKNKRGQRTVRNENYCKSVLTRGY